MLTIHFSGYDADRDALHVQTLNGYHEVPVGATGEAVETEETLLDADTGKGYKIVNVTLL